MTLPVAESEARAPRRDAVRNQQRVLDAGRAVLAEDGLNATMELIAARAGVGVGTVYRHFATKDALLDELVRRIVAELTAAAAADLARGDGTGLEHFLGVIGQSFTEHRGYAHLLVGRAAAKSGAEQLRQLIGELLVQAKEHGRFGADIGIGDIMATIWAMRGIVDSSGNVTPRGWRRPLDLHLAALRSPVRLSREPALTERQLERINHP